MSQEMLPSKDPFLNSNFRFGQNDHFSTDDLIHTKYGNNIHFSINANGDMVIFGEGEMPNYSTHNPSPFHQHRNDIKTIKIGGEITTIGHSSFIGFNQLKTTTVGQYVHTIYESAFSNCFNLSFIIFENEFTKCSPKLFSESTGQNHKIDYNHNQENNREVYKFCRDLFKCIEIPDSQSIQCFINQSYDISTKSKENDSTLRLLKNKFEKEDDHHHRNLQQLGGSCGTNAQYSIDTTTGIVTISGSGPISNYSQWGDSPFLSYSSTIKTIIIGYGITSIGQKAFTQLRYLTNLTISNSVVFIDEQAFWDCTRLTELTIPNSVTSIGNAAFSSCEKLVTLKLSNTLSSLGNLSFGYCESLERITLPSSLTTIGPTAFYGCTKIIAFEVDEENNCYTSIDGILFSKNMEKIYRYPPAKLEEQYTIPSSITSIEGGVFESSKLASITIPSSITFIGDYAFRFCSRLTQITLPNEIPSIGIGTFSGCSCLRSITIPNSVTSIGASAFASCTNLTSIVIPNGITSIPNGAFSFCINLTSITIPTSVTSIGSFAFRFCQKLTSIIIPGSVTLIEFSAFEECYNLNEVIYLGEYAPQGDYGSFMFCRFPYVTVLDIYQNETFCGYPVNRTLQVSPTNTDHFTLSNTFSDSLPSISDSQSITNSYTITPIIPYSGIQSLTHTLTITYTESVTMSIIYEPTNVFITSFYSNGDYTILQSQTYERTEIPIYSMIIIPTEYDIDIYINPQPTTDTHKKMKLIAILGMSIGIPVIVVCITILICFLTKSKKNINMNSQKVEYSISDVSENTQIMKPLLGATFY